MIRHHYYHRRFNQLGYYDNDDDNEDIMHYTGWPKKMAQFLYALTSSNINRFSKLFHCQNQVKTCNRPNSVTKDPSTSQLCRYTTL